MGLNENMVKGKWTEAKGEILKAWGKLTDNDLEQTKGDMVAIGGLIQQRYGEAQEATKKKLSEIMSRFEVQRDETLDQMKNKLKE